MATTPESRPTVADMINRFRTAPPSEPQLRKSLRDSGNLKDFWWSEATETATLVGIERHANEGFVSRQKEDAPLGTKPFQVNQVPPVALLRPNQDSSNSAATSGPWQRAAYQRADTANEDSGMDYSPSNTKHASDSSNLESHAVDIPSQQELRDVEQSQRTQSLTDLMGNWQHAGFREEEKVPLRPSRSYSTEDTNTAAHRDILSTGERIPIIQEPDYTTMMNAADVVQNEKSASDVADDLSRVMEQYVVDRSRVTREDFTDQGREDEEGSGNIPILAGLRSPEVEEITKAQNVLQELSDRAKQRMAYVRDELLKPESEQLPLDELLEGISLTEECSNEERETEKQAAEADLPTVRDDIVQGLDTVMSFLDKRLGRGAGDGKLADLREVERNEENLAVPEGPVVDARETDLHYCFQICDQKGDGLISVNDACEILRRFNYIDAEVDEDEILRLANLPTGPNASRHLSWEDLRQVHASFARDASKNVSHTRDRSGSNSSLETRSQSSGEIIEKAKDLQYKPRFTGSVNRDEAQASDNVLDQYHVPVSRSGRRGFILPPSNEEEEENNGKRQGFPASNGEKRPNVNPENSNETARNFVHQPAGDLSAAFTGNSPDTASKMLTAQELRRMAQDVRLAKRIVDSHGITTNNSSDTEDINALVVVDKANIQSAVQQATIQFYKRQAAQKSLQNDSKRSTFPSIENSAPETVKGPSISRTIPRAQQTNFEESSQATCIVGSADKLQELGTSLAVRVPHRNIAHFSVHQERIEQGKRDLQFFRKLREKRQASYFY